MSESPAMPEAMNNLPNYHDEVNIRRGSEFERSFDIEVFYDGDCPLCLKEIQMLQWLDRRRQRVRFTNIADPKFSAESLGKTMDELMAEIHGRLPSGEWIVGVEVFRQLYSAVGFKWLVAPSRLPLVSQTADWIYDKFAKNRLKWTGRCDGGTCKVPN